MNRTQAYLDHNATTPLRPEAMAAMREAWAETGNPSSVHAAGRRARSQLEAARSIVAAAVGAAPESVIFTSGATEANALALMGVPGPVLVSAVEHPSVLENAGSHARLPVDANGVLRLDRLAEVLAQVRPGLVSVMAANNETGVCQPVAAIAELVHRFDALLHVDAVQAVGRMPFRLDRDGADLCSLSAHKLGGPAGIGALVLSRDLPIRAQLRGGGQEGRRRAGTENLPGIVGFAAALGLGGDWRRIAALRDQLEAEVKRGCAGATIVGEQAERLPNTTCLITPGLRSEVQVMSCDLDGVAVSSGAACSSGKVAPSTVLAAMGYSSELAACAIRISLGWSSEADDIARFLEAHARLLRRRVTRAA